MSDTNSPTGLLLSPGGAIMAVIAVQLVMPFAKWVSLQLWGRMAQKEAEQDREKDGLKTALGNVVTEMRAGFGNVQTLISQQNVTIAEMKVMQANQQKEIDILREDRHEVRGLMQALTTKVELATLRRAQLEKKEEDGS